MTCKRCGSMDIEPVEVPRPDTIHHAELRCPECGAFLDWAPKPENRARRQAQRDAKERMQPALLRGQRT